MDDGAYQRLRALVRDEGVRRGFARLPLASRHRLASQARAGSREHLTTASGYITDVSQTAVEALMDSAGVNLMIHGHTHRPGVHHFRSDGADRTRIVLGDWHATSKVLQWDDAGWRLEACPG